MNVYYTPVALTKATEILSDTSPITVDASQGMIEKAIHNAIQNSIVTPLQNWLLGVWIKFVRVSHFACLGIATIGVIVWIIGIDKGKKIAIISVAIYLGIQLLNWVILGG